MLHVWFTNVSCILQDRFQDVMSELEDWLVIDNQQQQKRNTALDTLKHIIRQAKAQLMNRIDSKEEV